MKLLRQSAATEKLHPPRFIQNPFEKQEGMNIRAHTARRCVNVLTITAYDFHSIFEFKCTLKSFEN